MKNLITSSPIEMLTPIWQRLLQRPSVGAQDNFFELGGNPVLAIELFDEIARLCGRELSPLLIYQAPTIMALASLLEQDAPRLTSAVPLKSGSAWPPIFIAHGMGGSVMEFFELVKHIQLPYPIYGIQAKGTDGIDAPLEAIEDMAQYHLDSIKEIQPRGPYVFLGHSLGGLVAVEMAQRTSSSGEEVALLAMMDSYPHASHLSVGQRVGVFVRKIKRSVASRLKKKKMPDERLQSLFLSPATLRVKAAAQLALSLYLPHYFSGEIKFVQAAVGSIFPAPEAVWGHLARSIHVETVPGDHNGMLADHYEAVAAVLSRHVREALCRQ